MQASIQHAEFFTVALLTWKCGSERGLCVKMIYEV